MTLTFEKIYPYLRLKIIYIGKFIVKPFQRKNFLNSFIKTKCKTNRREKNMSKRYFLKMKTLGEPFQFSGFRAAGWPEKKTPKNSKHTNPDPE